MPAIKIITLPLPFRLGTVNCYLVETNAGFVLVDTGGSNQRAELEKELVGAGCQPGVLQLIVLTHGDFDHIGSAAYLREKFGTQIAMHQDDAGMAERGDMFWNRKSGGTLFRMIAPLLFRFAKSDRFKPDFYIEEGRDFSDYGFDAQVLSLPGHSKGSIGILTAGGDPSTGSPRRSLSRAEPRGSGQAGQALFCGDLLENSDKPALNSIMDDLVAANASVEKLKGFEVNTVYPGHGKPFPMEQFMKRIGPGKS
jgi:glyoxylase-like metal-dependent hydrolase (beta-lactamase superfamily II)